LSSPGLLAAFPSESKALPEAADKVWSVLGGGPSDLFYPEEFLGSWQVVSTLVDVDVPMGAEMLSNPKLEQRAKSELNRPLAYEQRFMRGPNGKVIADRSYNVTSITKATVGADLVENIEWEAENPNVMRIKLKGGPGIYTRVTRRFEDDHPEDRKLETSEVVEQVFETANDFGPPKVKGSRCLTKYKWRSEEQAKDKPVIIATQVVSDFVTVFDGEARVFEAQGRPSIVYTYRMSFQRTLS